MLRTPCCCGWSWSWCGVLCSWWERQSPPGGFWPPGSGFSKRLPRWEGLDLEARAGRFVPIGNGDRTHHGAAKSDGLRDRSAGEAEVMMEGLGHWNRVTESIMHVPCQVFF